MPNGGHAVPADDLGTYRKSEVAQLQASHDDLLAACEAVLHAFEQKDHWCEAVARKMKQIRTAITKAKGKP